MVIVDTSAWIEYTRNTGSPVCSELQGLDPVDLAICGVIRSEVLAGARNESELNWLLRHLHQAQVIPIEPEDYDAAARLYRQCRRQGETVRSMIDCIIAAVAIRVDVPILHHDGDFEALARHTPVETYALTGA